MYLGVWAQLFPRCDRRPKCARYVITNPHLSSLRFTLKVHDTRKRVASLDKWNYVVRETASFVFIGDHLLLALSRKAPARCVQWWVQGGELAPRESVREIHAQQDSRRISVPVQPTPYSILNTSPSLSPLMSKQRSPG